MDFLLDELLHILLKLWVLKLPACVEGNLLLNFRPNALVDVTSVTLAITEDREELLPADGPITVFVERIERHPKVVLLEQLIVVKRGLTELAEFDLAILVLVDTLENVFNLV